MKDFKFPYGNPYKVERILEHIEHDFPIVEYGDKHFQVILPFFFYKKASLWKWAESMDKSEESYKKLRFLGATPQEARSVLPISLKTEIIVTANFRELRLIFNLRCNKSSHPQMRQIILRALKILYEKSPTVFGDIYEKFTENK